ncbi:MAG: alanine racemase [Chlorobiaceae bacterium]|nr:alanine racemase [Chlorobiaceae bacterium]NTV61295.1 alanine racemase [Chlorobiaceae bacterium]
MAEALVSLENLRHNACLILSRLKGKARVMGIVKANAYGHNARKVSSALESIGIRDFGVANIHEAVELKTGGELKTRPTILAFSSPLASQIETYLHHDIDMTLCDIETMETADAVASANDRTINVHVKVDTGMGRLGIRPSSAMELLRRIDSSRGLRLKGIYTHFAESSLPGRYTDVQLSEFRALTSEYEHAASKTLCKHAANSGAILSSRDSWLDMVRPGILLYGYHPSENTPSRLDVRPVMQVEARVIFVKEIPAGTTISYNRTWTAPGPRRIATVSAGYADGYCRSLSNKSTVMIHGKPFRQVGTVTMDQIMVDLGEDPEVKKGDRVVLFGWDGLSADSIAGIAGTISYETLCSVSSRVKRIFI